MNVTALGEVGIVGGIAPCAASLVDGVLVVIVTSGDDRADAVGLDFGEAGVAVRWSRPLTGGPLHVSAQGWPFLPVASVVDDDEGRAFLVSGSTRMLVDAHSGEILRQTSVAISPSACSTLHEGLFLVPEARVLAAYDRRTLDLEWRRPAPGGMWIGGAVLDGLCPIGLFDQPEAEDAALPPMGLWDLPTDRVWPIPAARGTVRAGSLGVCGIPGGVRR